MPQFKEEKQFKFLSGAYPDDTFSVARFTGEEGISRIYELEIFLISEFPDIDLKKMMQHPAVLTVLRHYKESIPFHGILSQFEQLDEIKNHRYLYRAMLVPRLWVADQYHESTLFLDKSVPEIIEKILKQTGLSEGEDYQFKLMGSYPKREYITQFQETDLAFISRWMEREGIYYYFEQTRKGEKLIITDSNISHQDIRDGSEIRYSPPSGLIPQEEEIVYEFVLRQSRLPKKVILNEYNYRKPKLDLKVEYEVDPNGQGDVYIYGEHYQTPGEGKMLASVRAEELIAGKRIFNGESTAPQLCSGHYFSLQDHFQHAFDQKYLITQVFHEGISANADLAVTENEAPDEKNTYINSFEVIESHIQYRPPRKTQKPRIQGYMHSHVDAEGDGQYAEIDDQGRYKVVLPFDLSGKPDGKASRWVRMMQSYAGSDYGMHCPLHKNTEVVLSFVEGNPDRPYISGSIPNPATVSPVCTGNQTQSAIRTGGGNELHFEDQKGSENVYLYAEKDLNISINNDKNQSVGNNELLQVKNNRTKKVGADEKESIGNRKLSQIEKDLTETIGGNSSEKVGENNIYNVDSSIEIEAAESITLKCGASKLKMTKDGLIFITGVLLNTSGMINCNVLSSVTNITGLLYLKNSSNAVNLHAGVISLVDGLILAHVEGNAAADVSGAVTRIEGSTANIEGA